MILMVVMILLKTRMMITTVLTMLTTIVKQDYYLGNPIVVQITILTAAKMLKKILMMTMTAY